MNAEAWLQGHVGNAPPRLIQTMTDAVRAVVEGPSIPEQLAEAAYALFEQVVKGSGGREDALPLLAADALLTHAFEAQAELDPDGLEEFTHRHARADRLAALYS